jgi:hypothetical protein
MTGELLVSEGLVNSRRTEKGASQALFNLILSLIVVDVNLMFEASVMD